MQYSEIVPIDYTLAAERLEQELGSPMNPLEPFSFKHSVELDELEEFPSAMCHLLEEWGLQDYYVPAAYGGKQGGFDELFTLCRVVSRRDLSVAIAHSKTFLGSAPVWIAGTHEQKMTLAQSILNREYIALALTEEEHGGDLAASECAARKVHGRYLLSGTKWLVNNATRGTILCLLAKTHSREKAQGVSLFFIEKKKIDQTSFSHLPRIKTHGIRGIDISGIHFKNAVIDEEALIGREYRGLEPVLKTFQITRPLCSALSLGAADTALRLTLDFALKRRVYGSTVFSLPAARSVLIDAFTDLLICDCTALFAARALHVLPEQMSLWSSVTKYFVPTLLENMVQSVATILGARYYLREHYAFGVFQKIVRDIAIVSLFDGSTHVNLSLIASQLGQVVESEEGHNISSSLEAVSRLEQVCSLKQVLPEFDVEKLVLRIRGHDDLRLGLLVAATQFDEQFEYDEENPALKDDLKLLLKRFAQERKAVDQAIRELVARQGDIHITTEGFELAKLHCILHAASACYYLWLFNRSVLQSDFARGDWLVLCLIRLLKLLFPREEMVSSAPYSEQVLSTFLQQFHANRMFSVAPLQFASSRSNEHVDALVRRPTV